MLEWIFANAVTIMIAAIILLAVILDIRYIRKRKKNGAMCAGCSGCGGACHGTGCNTKPDNK